jgi:hypothetical protein
MIKWLKRLVEQIRRWFRPEMLCQLAGVTEVDKLEDAEYANIVQQAMVTNSSQATLLTQTVMYTLFQLYRVDGNEGWERI